MAAIFAFLSEHWILSGAFLILIILLVANEWRQYRARLGGVEPQELVDLLNHNKAIVIDVRSEEQYRKGHILGALNHPLAGWEEKNTPLMKYKSKVVVVVCERGLTAPQQSRLLKEKGFTHVHHLMGGMESWSSNSMPIVKK